jgi:cytochrome c553
MRNLTLLLFICGAVFAGAQFAGAGDASKGSDIARTYSCTVCHHKDLDGKKESRIKNDLIAFRDGGRTPASMARTARSLSDEDIDNLAAYFSGK